MLGRWRRMAMVMKACRLNWKNFTFAQASRTMLEKMLNNLFGLSWKRWSLYDGLLLNCMKQVSRSEAFLVPSSRTARNRTNLLFVNSWWYRQLWMSEESTQSVLIRSRFQSTPKSCTRRSWTSELSTMHPISEWILHLVSCVVETVEELLWNTA